MHLKRLSSFSPDSNFVGIGTVLCLTVLSLLLIYPRQVHHFLHDVAGGKLRLYGRLDLLCFHLRSEIAYFQEKVWRCESYVRIDLRICGDELGACFIYGILAGVEKQLDPVAGDLRRSSRRNDRTFLLDERFNARILLDLDGTLLGKCVLKT